MSGSINEAEELRDKRDSSAFFVDRFISLWTGPLVVALIALLVLVLTFDGVGDSDGSLMLDGPGLTLDEVFNIDGGEYLLSALIDEGPLFFAPGGAKRVFGQRRYNPDHPPLARLWIGLVHAISRPAVSRPPREPRQPELQVVGARLASVLAFMATIVFVGVYTGRWHGLAAGTCAALALLLMPRVFAHAHLAALETGIGLIFTWTVLYVADRWSRAAHIIPLSVGRQPPGSASESGADSPPPHDAAIRLPPPRWSSILIAGVLFGLALLTKIQAVLLPIPIGLWALWRWRWRAIPLMLLFGLMGGVVFFVGWPWLWLDPVGHLREYFASKAERPTLYCYYLGTRYADVDVPWHYSFMMFLVTVPVGLHLLGVWGLFARQSVRGDSTGQPRIDSRAALLTTVVLFVLTFFALPGITVYDGARLFLVVFPLWAVLIGAGAVHLWKRAADNPRRRVIVTALLAAGLGEGVWANISLHPCQLSYYNLAVGGLRGADRLGFEPTYWRDSFTREFLEEVVDAVPEGSALYVAPVLHPANRIDLQLLSRILREHELQLDSYDDKDPAKRDMRYVLVFRRHADPWDALEPAPAGAQLLCEVRRADVQLAALYDLRAEIVP